MAHHRKGWCHLLFYYDARFSSLLYFIYLYCASFCVFCCVFTFLLFQFCDKFVFFFVKIYSIYGIIVYTFLFALYSFSFIVLWITHLDIYKVISIIDGLYIIKHRPTNWFSTIYVETKNPVLLKANNIGVNFFLLLIFPWN